jgi:hypothetical protein
LAGQYGKWVSNSHAQNQALAELIEECRIIKHSKPAKLDAPLW